MVTSGLLIDFAVGKCFALQRRFAGAEARYFTSHSTPELNRAYSAFSEARQISANRQPYKGRDLWRLLERYRPSSIVELGSGTTSAVFALWTLRYKIPYLAYEHHPEWAEVTRRCLRQAGIPSVGEIRVVPSRVREDNQATGFIDLLPLDADFVYIDGPPSRLADGRKVPNDDITRLFEAGGTPSTIVVDGRLETVDLIRSHPVGGRYRCAPSFVYCRRRGLWASALSCREHTVFRLT